MRHFATEFCVAVAALLCIPQALANRGMEFFEQYDLSELRYVGLSKRRATLVSASGLPCLIHGAIRTLYVLIPSWPQLRQGDADQHNLY